MVAAKAFAATVGTAVGATAAAAAPVDMAAVARAEGAVEVGTAGVGGGMVGMVVRAAMVGWRVACKRGRGHIETARNGEVCSRGRS